MTRHTLLENFDNFREVGLAKGDLVIVLECDRYGDKGGDAWRYSGLEKAGGYYHVMVKTRHGRKVRVPRHLLSKEEVPFHCQLCSSPEIPSYRQYVEHMIDHHLRSQLLRGLDMSKKIPACPFPSCHGIAWPVVDNLLFHYASHHNVIEKVIMYESELAAEELRRKLREKEAIVESMAKEIGDATKSTKDEKRRSGSNEFRNDRRGSGSRDSKEVISQMRDDIEIKRQKLGAKNVTIKTLRDNLEDAKKNSKEVDQKYQDLLIHNSSMEAELKELYKERNLRSYSVRPSHISSNYDENLFPPSPGSRSSKYSAGSPSGENNVSSTAETAIALGDRWRRRTDLGHPGGGFSPPGLSNPMEFQIQSLKQEIENREREIENLNLQNENLKSIIEIGKTTVETAKELSQDLAEENKTLKEKHALILNNVKMEELERDLKQLKDEYAEMSANYNRTLEQLKSNQMEVTKLRESCRQKSAEINQLHVEKANAMAKENHKHEDNQNLRLEIKNVSASRDEAKSRLFKCRENCRNLGEKNDQLESNMKVMMNENRNAAAEIKNLKSSLNSSRSIVVEKTTKDDVVKVKADLTSKTIELEKCNVKLKKVSTELNNVLGELKLIKGSKTSNEEYSNLKEQLKNASKDLNLMEEAQKDVKERMESYVTKCAQLETKEVTLQEEIILLQTNIKDLSLEIAAKGERFRETVQALEDAIVFYKQQEDLLLEEVRKLKQEALNRDESQPVSGDEKGLASQYKVKCEQVENLQKKQEIFAAQLKRKDWEIDNYQRKLDYAFQAGVLALPTGVGPSDLSNPTPPVRSPQSSALDLTTKYEEKEDDKNNNLNIKLEDQDHGTASLGGFVSPSCKRKFSECSPGGAAGQESTAETSSDGLVNARPSLVFRDALPKRRFGPIQSQDEAKL